ncbi:MAG TPA: hypothetical protein PKD26_02185 [Pyrinomonadaceae bacterium]|nr:hypothetical protein [Pyrinomonadaceae bacterium]
MVCILAVGTPGQGGQTRSAPPLAASSAERIHLGDIVDVDVEGSFEFDWRGGLTPEGYLDGLDKASERIYALCRTEAEVGESIKLNYQRILRSPIVRVTIIDKSNRALAYLHGAVRQSHRYQLRRPATLLEMIVMSGGITDRANGEIVIFRPPNARCTDNEGSPRVEAEDDLPQRFSVKIADILAGVPGSNPMILSGDIVNVLENYPVFVMSGSNVALRMNLTPDLTLTRAIEATVGPVAVRKASNVRIYRRKDGGAIIEADVRRISKGAESDPALQPFDVIQLDTKGIPQRRVIDRLETDASLEPLGRLPLRIVD